MRIEHNLGQCFCVAASVAFAFVLSACTREREPATAADTRPTRTLVRALGAEPETLDPSTAADNASLAVLQDLYEGLVAERPDGSAAPGAAERWEVASDGKTWRFHLRKGLRWSDGTPLEAAHFAAAFERLTAEESQAPSRDLLQAMANASAPQSDIVEIKLERPLPQLAALLALPMCAPRRIGASNLVGEVGNGPYRLVRRVPGQRIELERNPHYVGAQAARIEHIVYLTLEDLDTELKLYRAGELQLTSEVPNSQLGWLREQLPRELHVAPYLSTYAYAVNLARLRDRSARTALTMAIDRAQITKLVTGAGERPAYEWVAPGIAGYPATTFEWRDSPNDARVDAAQAAWREATARGVAPKKLTLCTDASANHRRTAVALADHWRRVLGVEVSIRELEWTVYLATRERPGDCDLVRLGWSADFADPEAFAVVFESGNPQNTLGYSSRRYDALLEESRHAATADERSRLLAAAEAELLRDVPVIPLFHRVTKRLAKPELRGLSANPLGHLPSRQLSFD